jgi:hypothetical protein
MGEVQHKAGKISAHSVKRVREKRLAANLRKININQSVNSKINWTSFSKVVNWAVKEKVISIDVFGDIYFLKMNPYHKMGNMQAEVGSRTKCIKKEAAAI